MWFSQTAELLWFLSWSKAAVLLPDVEICGAKAKINQQKVLCDDTKGKPCAIIRKQVWPLTDHCAVWWKKIWRVQHQHYKSIQHSVHPAHTGGWDSSHLFWWFQKINHRSVSAVPLVMNDPLSARGDACTGTLCFVLRSENDPIVIRGHLRCNEVKKQTLRAKLKWENHKKGSAEALCLQNCTLSCSPDISEFFCIVQTQTKILWIRFWFLKKLASSNIQSSH